jgi:hypothetical protein
MTGNNLSLLALRIWPVDEPSVEQGHWGGIWKVSLLTALAQVLGEELLLFLPACSREGRGGGKRGCALSPLTPGPSVSPTFPTNTASLSTPLPRASPSPLTPSQPLILLAFPPTFPDRFDRPALAPPERPPPAGNPGERPRPSEFVGGAGLGSLRGAGLLLDGDFGRGDDRSRVLSHAPDGKFPSQGRRWQGVAPGGGNGCGRGRRGRVSGTSKVLPLARSRPFWEGRQGEGGVNTESKGGEGWGGGGREGGGEGGIGIS